MLFRRSLTNWTCGIKSCIVWADVNDASFMETYMMKKSEFLRVLKKVAISVADQKKRKWEGYRRSLEKTVEMANEHKVLIHDDSIQDACDNPVVRAIDFLSSHFYNEARELSPTMSSLIEIEDAWEYFDERQVAQSEVRQDHI